MNFNLKVACTATLLAMGVSAHAAADLNKQVGNKTTITASESDNGKKRVIVKYKAGHTKAAKSMALKAGGTVKRNLKRHSAFAIEVSEKALAGLRNNPNVEYVEEDYPVEFLSTNLNQTEVSPFGISSVQADLVSDSNTGNRSICIIDSGYDINHTDLSSNSVDGTNQSGTGNWYEASGSHGTHVAGTVAAVANGSGVVGVNPSGNVNIHVTKMFGDSYNSDLVAAADDCVAAGANVITMSLRAGNTITAKNAFQSYADNGVLNIAAAGNDGDSTLRYPASYDSVMAVGATDSGNMHANFSNSTAKVEIAAPGESVLSSVDGDGYLGQLTVGGADYFANGVVPQITFDSGGNPNNDVNVGSASGALGACTTSGTSYSCPSMSGKICLVERDANQGDDSSTSQNKYPENRGVDACVDAGAVGVVVYSNADRPGLQSPFLADWNNKIGSTPVVSVDRATGLELANRVGESASVEKQNGQDWAYYNGTSMATPHVSGVATLVWSHHPACTNDEIRQVLKDTALDIDVPGRDDNTGYGLVQARAALDYLDANGCAGSSNPVNEAPVADFSYSCTALSCDFDASASTDDSGVVSYSWSFGSTGVTASNTFASEGTYSVTLTVADAEGLESSVTQSVSVSDSSQEPSNISLEASRFWFGYYTSLNWSGAQGTAVDVYRNGVFIGSTANDGYEYVTELNINQAHVYKVCETGSTTSCSNLSVSWAY